MAIIIDKRTEELIRTIGRRTGEPAGAVIRRLAEAEAGPERGASSPSSEIVEMRLARYRGLRERYRRPDDPNLTWEEIEGEMDAIFDDEREAVGIDRT